MVRSSGIIIKSVQSQPHKGYLGMFFGGSHTHKTSGSYLVKPTLLFH